MKTKSTLEHAKKKGVKKANHVIFSRGKYKRRLNFLFLSTFKSYIHKNRGETRSEI